MVLLCINMFVCIHVQLYLELHLMAVIVIFWTDWNVIKIHLHMQIVYLIWKKSYYKNKDFYHCLADIICKQCKKYYFCIIIFCKIYEQERSHIHMTGDMKIYIYLHTCNIIALNSNLSRLLFLNPADKFTCLCKYTYVFTYN